MKISEERLKEIRDIKDIDYSDIPKLTGEQLSKMKPLHPVDAKLYKPRKETVTIRLDADVLQTLRKSGKGWQTHLNDFIRQGVEQGRL